MITCFEKNGKFCSNCSDMTYWPRISLFHTVVKFLLDNNNPSNARANALEIWKNLKVKLPCSDD